MSEGDIARRPDRQGPPQAIALAAGAGTDAVGVARRWVRSTAASLDLVHLADDAELVTAELVTNAVLHAGTAMRLSVEPVGDGLRIEVHDGAPDRLPVTSGTGLLELFELDDLDDVTGGLSALDVETMTGRGMTLVEAVTECWGVDVGVGTKAVWAELATGCGDDDRARSAAVPATGAAAVPGVPVWVVGVPVRLVLTAAAQLDDLVRELGITSLPTSLPPDIVDVAARFVTMTALVRDPFRVAARAAVERQQRLLDVTFTVGGEGVQALRGFLAVLEQITDLSVRGELLCLAPPPEIMAFRRWAVDEIARQAEGVAPTPCPFPVVPADDPHVTRAARAAALALDGVDAPEVEAEGWLAAARDDLASATDLADVVTALVAAGGALGAVNGSLCLLAPDGFTVELSAEVGYATEVRDHWTTFPITLDAPASEVIRTGQAIFLRTAEELRSRFPVFRGTPVIGSEALAVVPITGSTQVRGAMLMGFAERRPFGPDDQTLLRALGALVGTALAASDPSRRPAEMP